MDALAPLRRFDRFQQRHPALAVPIAVARKFGNDEGPHLAGLIAFRAFFSLFPLLLLFTAILGYLLAGDPELRDEAVASVLSQLPVVGEQLRAESLQGSGVALGIGLAGSIWAGFGVVLATERALDRVWAIPHRERRDFLMARLRALLLLVVLGALALTSTAASGLVGGGAEMLGALTGIAVSLALNLLVFGSVFAVLGSRPARLRTILPGVAVAAAGWTGLQLFGGYFVAHEVRNAAPAYGTFALVLGLLVWLNLGASLLVLCAELNVVWERRLWPRSLLGFGLTQDERVLAGLARAEARDDRELIEIRFRRPDPAPSGRPPRGPEPR